MKPRPIGNGKTGALSSSCSVGIVDEGDESTYFRKQVVAFLSARICLPYDASVASEGELTSFFRHTSIVFMDT